MASSISETYIGTDSPSPRHKVYRDIFSMACAGVTTPDELFQIIARRLEQAKDSEASARALVERRCVAYAVMNF